IRQTPYDEGTEEDPKWAAFTGSALGDRLEFAYSSHFPPAQVQVTLTAVLPSGVTIPGHADVIDPEINGAIDFKAKDGLTGVPWEPQRRHCYQVALYVLGAVQAGLLREGAEGYIVYADRSGHEVRPLVHTVTVDDALLLEIDEWIGDTIYAAQHNEEAPRDMPFDWCRKSCPFFLSCRGDTILGSGLIEDPEVVRAAEVYMEASKKIRELELARGQARNVLEGESGTIPRLGISVSWTEINASEPFTVIRKPYRKINIRELP